MYKLAAGLYGQNRMSDFGDVQKMIERNNLSKDFTKLFRRDLRNKYEEIWNNTKV